MSAILDFIYNTYLLLWKNTAFHLSESQGEK